MVVVCRSRPSDCGVVVFQSGSEPYLGGDPAGQSTALRCHAQRPAAAPKHRGAGPLRGLHVLTLHQEAPGAWGLDQGGAVQTAACVDGIHAAPKKHNKTFISPKTYPKGRKLL